MNKHITPPLIVQYSEKNSSTEPDLLQELNRVTHLTQMQPHMLSGHLQGRALSMFSKMVNPKYILEIGTYTGYAALCLAEGLQPNGKLITIDVDVEKQEICQTYFAKSTYANNIEILIGNAVEIIPALHYPWDLIFIDADKINYSTYYNLLLPVVKSGTFIIVDNVLFNGEVIEDVKSKNASAVHAFNALVANDASVEKVLLPIRDGLTIIRKK